MIRDGSRYTDAEFIWAPARDTTKFAAYLNTITVLTAPYFVHIVREGDTLHTLASLYYRDTDKWWLLADANPQIFSPLHIRPGDPVRVPQ
jgi:nucleoid-associated protein YgaU